jgi:nicotinamidase-related amidase
MTGPAGPEGAPDEPQATLVVIDMQRVFGERDSAWFTPRFGEIVGPIQRLIGAYRPRVVFTRFVAPAVPSGAWRRYYELWPFALQPPDARIYELVDEFAGEPGPTVDATTFGKVGDQLSAMTGGGRLVLTGVSTDCCVLSTALAAADDGVAVQVVADACAGLNDETHAKALDILRLYSPLVEVISLAEAIGQAPGAGSAPAAPGG